MLWGSISNHYNNGIKSLLYLVRKIDFDIEKYFNTDIKGEETELHFIVIISALLINIKLI